MKTKELTILEVTTLQLVQILMTVVRGTFSNIWFETRPKMKKGRLLKSGEWKDKNPYYDYIKDRSSITKITKGNILIGGDYEKRMKKELNDPNFVSGENKVGDHVGDGMCILFNENTGKHYLQYEWFQEVTPKSTYLLDENDPIEKSQFESYMGTFTPREVLIQSVTVDNIKEMTFNKTKYVVVNN